MDPTTLTDTDLDALARACYAEQQRRERITEAPSRLAELLRSVHNATGGDGRPWQPVTGAHSAVPAGAVVAHQDRFWRAKTVASHEPGTPGTHDVWEEVWPDGNGGWTTERPDLGPRAWAIGLTAEIGDKFTHNGRLWECKVAHTIHAGWPPGPDTHAVWTDLGPA